MKKKFGHVIHSPLRVPSYIISNQQDHAPGALLIEEAGGKVTDSRGESLNFGLGRTLGKNYGVIACGAHVHSIVLDSVQVALSESKELAKNR